VSTLVNPFEAGTNGAALTAGSGGNTGGSGGNYFDTVSVVAGGTLTFDAAHAAHGALSASVTTGSTSGTSYCSWNTSLGSGWPTVWFRQYLYFTAWPSAGYRTFHAYTSAAGVACGGVIVNSNGTLAFVDRNGVSITGTVTTETIPLNAWFRIEGFITGDSSAGQAELQLFFTAMDAVTPDNTYTSAATQNTQGTIGEVRFGINLPRANAGPSWSDDVGVSVNGYIGPATALPDFAINVDPPPRPPAWSPWSTKAPGMPLGEPYQAWPYSTTAEYPSSPGRVISLGTPVPVLSTTSPVTGTWGTGQNRVTGNLLIAAVSAGAATSVTAITASGSWALVGVQAAEGHTQVAFFSLTAAGGDAAPSFSSTLSSTAAMSCTLYEFTGANTASPGDTWGTAGLTGTTANPLTVTTAGNVAAAGEYALCCHVELISVAGTVTWAPDAAFTNDTSDVATSTRIHTAVDHLAKPAPGSTLSCGGTWGTVPAHEAAQIIVIAAGVIPSTASAAGAGSATAVVTQAAVASAAGAGSVTATAVVISPAAAAAAGAASAVATQIAPAGSAGAGSVTDVATQTATATAAGAGAVTAKAAQSAIAAAAAAGSVTDAVTQIAVATAAGAGSVTAAGSSSGAATGAAAGAGSVTDAVTQAAIASAAGTAAASAGAVQAAGGAAAGAGTAGPAAATQAVIAAAAGTGAVTDAVTQIATATAAGAGSVTAAGSSSGAASAAVAGAGAVAAVAAQAATAAAPAAGQVAAAAVQIATATAAGAATVTAAGQLAGTASIAGAGAAAAKAVQAATAAAAAAGALSALAVQQAIAAIAAAGSVTAVSGTTTAFTVGALTASGAAAGVLTAAGASSALTGSTAPGSTLTATAQTTGGPS
jgi:hypothetical protein